VSIGEPGKVNFVPRKMRWKALPIARPCLLSVLCVVVFALTTRQIFWRSCPAALGILCRSCPKACERGFGEDPLPPTAIGDYQHFATRTLFIVITGSPNHAGRARAIKETWLSQVPCYVIYSDADDAELGIIGLPETGNDYNGSQRKWAHGLSHAVSLSKTPEGIKVLCPNIKPSGAEPNTDSTQAFDWFVFVDDDTFIYLPHLYRELSRHNTAVPLALGSTDAANTRADGIMGGAAMALSASLAEALVTDHLLLRCDKQYPQNSDLVLMKCIRGTIPQLKDDVASRNPWQAKKPGLPGILQMTMRFPWPVIFDVCGFGIGRLDEYAAQRDIRYLISLHLHGNGTEMRECYHQFYSTETGVKAVAELMQPC
jgi:Fringe-like